MMPNGDPSMRKMLLMLCLLAPAIMQGAAPPAASDWMAKVVETMPLLGHRNWILIVDSAYPLQSAPGIETIETNASQEEVVKSVLDAIHRSLHVRADIFMDAELPFVSDQDAPGASAYRAKIADLLHSYKVESLPHEKIIDSIDQA